MNISKDTNNHILVADIGGTNARFAMFDPSSSALSHIKTLSCASYASLNDAINSYLDFIDLRRPEAAAIAVATAVNEDYLEMTNNHWKFSVKEVREILGFERLKVINDFTALALAIPHLTDSDCIQLGGSEIQLNGVKAVIGPGTGLGVSGLINITGTWFPLQSEGGHVSYGAQNARETQIINVLRSKGVFVSAENIVSGQGLSLLHDTISHLEGAGLPSLLPREISERALNGQCSVAEEALSIFCEILGTVAANVALTIGSTGGVYIGGGIIPKNSEYFFQSKFRMRFEKNEQCGAYLKEIPSYVIMSKYPALIGAAHSMHEEYFPIGINSVCAG